MFSEILILIKENFESLTIENTKIFVSNIGPPNIALYLDTCLLLLIKPNVVSLQGQVISHPHNMGDRTIIVMTTGGGTVTHQGWAETGAYLMINYIFSFDLSDSLCS